MKSMRENMEYIKDNADKRLMELRTKEVANVFIIDGVLEKYRYCGEDPYDMTDIKNILHHKAVNNMKLTAYELTHIVMNEENVAIYQDGQIVFYNITDWFGDRVNAISEFYQNRRD